MDDEKVLCKFLGCKEQDGKRTVRDDFLDNQLFRFTQPSLLNDPFEMKPIIMVNKYSEEDYAVAREKARQLFGDYEDSKLSNEELEGSPLLLPGMTGRTLYEIRPFPQTIPEYRKEPFKSKEEVEEFLVQEIYSKLLVHLDEYGIFSLSETKENLLMWSHYAEYHKGMAVSFNISHPFFKYPSNKIHKLEYTNRRISITSNKRVVRIAGRYEEVPLRLLFRKHTDWSYEREWRMIRKLDECHHRDGEVCLFKIPNEAIKSLTLGANMSQEDVEKVCDKVASSSEWSHLTVYRAKLSKQEFGLEFDQL